MPRSTGSRPALAVVALAVALAGVGPARAQAPARGEPEVWVAVAPRALVAALEPLRAHREREGLRALVVVTDEVDRGLGGARPALARRQAAYREAALAHRPTYLLLVGGPDAVPGYAVAETYTDRPWGDLDGDGLPEVSVGRLPARDAGELTRMVARTVAYETTLRAPDPWRKRCALVAGEGRFGPAIDLLLEQMFQRIVASKIPAGYDVDLTYANPTSPYCYAPEGFSDRVVERAQEGALVLAYVGHGELRSVDDLTVRGPDGRVRRYPVLDAGRAADLATDAPPVVVALACWTGNFEDPRRSIGEELLRTGRGPVAFYGATRVSHPVHNALLGIALIGQLFGEDGPARLGPAVDRAETTLLRDDGDPLRAEVRGLALPFVGARELEAECPRHVDMYNLLGDPALRLARPTGRVALEAPARAAPGAPLAVSGHAPGARGVVVTLELARDRLRPAPGPETDVERYARANDKVLWTELVRVGPDGRFTATLRVPDDAAGPCFVRAFAAGEGERCAIGARPVTIGAAPAR